MTAAAIAALVVSGLLAGALGWRAAARRRSLPCPAWLAWVLENPYTNAVASNATILDRLELAAGMRVLDAGCGPGRLTVSAAERVGPAGEVVALDVQEAMLRRVRAAVAERGLANVRTVQGSLESAMLGARDFDRALLVTVLGEVPDREGAMRALYAALRPGGLLSVTEMLPDPHYQGRRTVHRLAEAAGFRLDRAHGTWLAFTMNFRKPLQ
jgi:ubiquinone/menaquinone biosynthesis C-methylase UbiE